ncbi:MAG: hypothetical protein R2747_17210 [Pyrinomonadaceae bacterium]
MPSTSVISGALLILLGIIGYVYGLTTDYASPTALIPAAFGLLLLIFGLLAQSKETLRKHLMHAAVLIALLGFLASAGRLISKISQISLSMAFISQLLMSVICLAFVLLGIKSFIDARRNQ